MTTLRVHKLKKKLWARYSHVISKSLYYLTNTARDHYFRVGSAVGRTRTITIDYDRMHALWIVWLVLVVIMRWIKREYIRHSVTENGEKKKEYGIRVRTVYKKACVEPFPNYVI